MMYANKLCHQAICVQTLLMKDSLFDLQYKIAADYDFLLKLYMENYIFRYVGNHAIAYFRLSGISSLNTVDKVNEQCDIATKRVLLNQKICSNEGLYMKLRNKIKNHRLYGAFQGICRDYKQKKCHINCADLFTNTDYIVFGAGVVGRQLKWLLETLGVNVKCFIDNNQDLLFTNIDGASVVNLHNIDFIKGSIVLISSYEDSDEMAESLNDLGLKEDRDYYKFETWVKLVKNYVMCGGGQ